MLEISVDAVQQVSVVRLAGEIDATSAAQVQQAVLGLAGPGCKILLDVTRLAYMSSAGLRAMLSISRQITGKKGHLILVGLSEALKDTMSLTGFLDFFDVQDSFEAGFRLLG
jgi:anti-sigma B factor antagonist